MEAERKTLTQLSVPICLETLIYMLSGMVDTLMLSSVSDQAVGAVGTANTYIGVFIIMFGVISSGMIAVMTQNIGTGIQGMVDAGDRWEDESEIAATYLNNMGAYYGSEKNWEKFQQFAFEAALTRTDVVVQPRQRNTRGA